MKSIMIITATVACAFALIACGGGGNSSSSNTTSSLADEGIWSDLNSNETGAFYYGMQSVILSDGSYWGIYGSVQTDNTFVANGILHGTTKANGNSVSGTYTDTLGESNGTYSGTVSAQNNLDLTFDEPSNSIFAMIGESVNMGYDSIYNQSTSLSVIAGNYPAISYAGTNSGGPGTLVGQSANDVYPHFPDNLTVAGSNLTVYQDGNVIMTGTIAQHGTTGVFDVSLTTTTAGVIGYFPGTVSAGTTFNGILFQTSSGILENDIEIIAAAGNSAFFYLGSK